MKLFPHNQRAVDSVLKIFKERKSTCVIHPTGTGKGIIVSTLINRHPKAKHLLLAPGKHIFEEVGQYVRGENWQAKTYIGLLTTNLKELRGFDYIYLDEFHRCGADIWGRLVVKILKLNPGAKVLGTSATHIRYLDNVRNMSFELFEGSVASHITLHRAFIDGILRPPIYISALYSIDEEYRSLARKITRSDHDGKKLLAAQLKNSVIDWERTAGIDKILQKHIPKNRKKIIVFCRDYKELLGAEKKLTPVFRKIFGKVQVLKSHSNFSSEHNRKVLAQYREISEVAKVMFTVDMFNEGLHGKDISVGILLRETSSPTVFYQQIGRCFSAGQTERPIIFDFVNNIENVQFRMFRLDYEEERKAAESEHVTLVKGGKVGKSRGAMIEFIDETKGFRDLMISFARQVDNWDVYYAKAQQFYGEHGHLRVPTSDRDLYTWLQFHRVYKRRVNLSEEKIKALEAIGMEWGIKSFSDVWDQHLGELKEFIKRHGRVPVRLKGKKGLEEELELATWLAWNRKRYADGKLSKLRAELLGALIPLKIIKPDHWKDKIEALKKYKKKTGAFKFSPKDPFYRTVQNIRTSLKQGNPPKKVLAELKKMGYPLERQRNTWEDCLVRLKTFVKEMGRLPEWDDDGDNYKWLRKQHYRYAEGLLKPDQVEALTELGVLKRNRRAA